MRVVAEEDKGGKEGEKKEMEAEGHCRSLRTLFPRKRMVALAFQTFVPFETLLTCSAIRWLSLSHQAPHPLHQRSRKKKKGCKKGEGQ